MRYFKSASVRSQNRNIQLLSTHLILLQNVNIKNTQSIFQVSFNKIDVL
jgi:hypothetical protein